MNIVAISDVHERWNKLIIPECDVLISAGDYSITGQLNIVKKFHSWLNEQPARYIISVQGNHEKLVEENFEISKMTAKEACPKVHFIDEGLVEIENLKIWCSAITPYFCDWAWNKFPGDEIQTHWDKIPNDIDILVTHGPPFGILDTVEKFNNKICEFEIEHCGCPQLLKRVLEVKPKVHIFGHIHEGSGIHIENNINFINASICDKNYKPNNPIRIFNL